MSNWFKKGILSGIGLGLFAKEKVEEKARQLAEEAKLSEDETKEFIEELRSQAEKTRRQVDERVQQQVQDAVERMGLVTQADLSRLEKKIDAMSKPASGKGRPKGQGTKKQKAEKEPQEDKQQDSN